MLATRFAFTATDCSSLVSVINQNNLILQGPSVALDHLPPEWKSALQDVEPHLVCTVILLSLCKRWRFNVAQRQSHCSEVSPTCQLLRLPSLRLLNRCCLSAVTTTGCTSSSARFPPQRCSMQSLSSFALSPYYLFACHTSTLVNQHLAHQLFALTYHTHVTRSHRTCPTLPTLKQMKEGSSIMV